MRHTPSDTDIGHAMQLCTEAMHSAHKDKVPLRFIGNASKLGDQAIESPNYRVLNLGNISGVINYEPSELFITAFAGTRLLDIVSLLAEQNQCLACDVPMLHDATLGGVVATNASGSASHSCGRVRDAILGVRLVNGLGESLNFGGGLMKNVAGFDVARLNCGAYGKLGALVTVTLRVRPMLPQLNLLGPECSAADALKHILTNSQSSSAVVASSWYKGRLLVRLEGSSLQLERVHNAYYDDWEEVNPTQDLWQELTEQCFEGVQGQHHLIVRMICQPHTAVDCLQDTLPFCIDEGGRLRWYQLDTSHHLQLLSQGVFFTLAKKGVHITRHVRPYMPLNNLVKIEQQLAELQNRILHAFDPYGLCNPDLTWYGL